MTYFILKADSIPSYLGSLPAVTKVLGNTADINIEEIGDGNLNFVYRVTSQNAPEKSVILKQAVPYLRMAGDSWPLSRDRMKYEIRALKIYEKVAPQYIPKVFYSDEEMSVLVMENLSQHRVVRYGMMDGETYENVGHHVGNFLAESLFKTSSLYMPSTERRELMSQFVLNSELCKLTEDFIFTFPYIEHESNYLNQISNNYANETIRIDDHFKLNVLKFKELFLTKTDALLHGDIHTGSLMANKNETYVIDPEFAFFGPFGFDVGKIIGNLLLCYTSHFHHSSDSSYQDWLLGQAVGIWKTFETRFLELWSASPESAHLVEKFVTEATLNEYKKQYLLKIMQDTVGFCACSIARRTLGIAGVAEIRTIENEITRGKLEIINIELSRMLMSNHETITGIEHLESLIKTFYANVDINTLELR
ncbi:MAG: S-methyl-5-thioribose kinase [Methylophilaceae bacterium]